MTNRNVIYIPTSGQFKIYTIILERPNYESLLKCEITDGFSLPSLDIFGYRLAIIMNDFGGEQYNNIASVISNKDITGDVILVDDEQDLDLDKLKEILKISRGL